MSSTAEAIEAVAKLIGGIAAEVAMRVVEERLGSPALRYATAKNNPMGSGRRFRAAARRGEFKSFKDGREVKALWRDVEVAMEAQSSKCSETAQLEAELLGASTPRRASPDGYIYFLRAESTGLIKIGVTCDLRTRLHGMSSTLGGEVELLHACTGTQADERALHKRFAAARKAGEWFEAVPELLAHIEELRAASPTIELPRRREPKRRARHIAPLVVAPLKAPTSEARSRVRAQLDRKGFRAP